MLAFFTALTLQASAPAQDTIRLTFVEAMDRARAANPEFVQQTIQADNAEISMATARATRYYPRLDMNFTVPSYSSNLVTVRREDGSEIFVPVERRSVAMGLSLSQPLPTGGRLEISGDVRALNQPLLEEDQQFSGVTDLGIRLEQDLFGINRSIRDYRLARESYARARAQFADRQRSLSRNVLSAYLELVQARKQAELDSILAVRDAERLESIRTRANEEPMSEVDSLKFELQRVRAAASRANAGEGLKRAQAELNEVLAYPVTTVIIPDTSIRVQPFIPDVTTGMAQALANRQDLRLAEMSVDNRRAQLRDAHRTSPITLSIEMDLGFNGSSRASGLSRALSDAIDRQDRARSIDLGVSVPIFDRFSERHAIARARNELESAEANLEDERRQIENEVLLAAERVTNAVEQLALAERTVALTRRTLEIQSTRYQRGAITSAELLQDQASYRGAEIQLLEVQIEFLSAAEDWRRAIGERAPGN